MHGTRLGIALIVGLALVTSDARAQSGSQLPNPRLLTATPCGARAGSVVTVTVGGTDLEDPESLQFSHAGIRATPIIPPKPKAEPKKPPPPPTPVTQFQVQVNAQTPPGLYEVRLANRWGISNPRTFVVGDLGELPEKEPNDDVDKAQRVPLNTTVTGTIGSPTDVDYFVFSGKKGQRVLVVCLGQSIDSRLVPEIRVYDTQHHEIAIERGGHGTDTVADLVLPSDGDYHVRLCSYTYSEGSPEHFYRLSITTAPWIDAIHPCVVEPGKRTAITVYGRNLPGGILDPSAVVHGHVLERMTATVSPPTDAEARHRLGYHGHAGPGQAVVDGFEYRVRNAAGFSNSFLLGLAKAPVVLSTDQHATPATAQQVPVPCEVAGRILNRGQRDWYTFTANKGEALAIEVFCDRIGGAADMYFLLRNAASQQTIVEVDTHNEALTSNFKFYQVTEDPGTYLFTAPADGRYELLVGSRYATSAFGIRHYYRLRLTRPEPDFHLVIVPTADSRPDGGQLFRNGDQLYTVLAWRHDGWDGPIELSAQGLPKGVTCPPQTLAAGLRQTSLVVEAAPDAPAWTGTIVVQGTATIDGKKVVRTARPASITWPVQPGSGIPAVARLDRSLALAVREQAAFRVAAAFDKPSVVQGGTTMLTLKLTRSWPDFKGPLTLQLAPQEVIPNVAVNNGAAITVQPNQKELKVPVNVNPQAAPGTYNLVLRGTASIPFNKDPKAKQKPAINVMQPSAPAELVIVPKQVATVTLANANPTVKAGAQGDVVVRVARMYQYAGPFKVRLVLPKGTTGVAAADTTIPAGKNEAHLVLKIAPKTPPGPRARLVVQLTALLPGNISAVQEATVNVTVVK